METKLGKIKKFRIGFGGYQDACYGVTIELGGDAWGVMDFKGTWYSEPSSGAKWTLDDQSRIFADSSRFIIETLQKSNKSDVNDLIGIPVEVVFNGGMLKSWRILTEVI